MTSAIALAVQNILNHCQLSIFFNFTELYFQWLASLTWLQWISRLKDFLLYVLYLCIIIHVH